MITEQSGWGFLSKHVASGSPLFKDIVRERRLQEAIIKAHDDGMKQMHKRLTIRATQQNMKKPKNHTPAFSSKITSNFSCSDSQQSSLNISAKKERIASPSELAEKMSNMLKTDRIHKSKENLICKTAGNNMQRSESN